MNLPIKKILMILLLVFACSVNATSDVLLQKQIEDYLNGVKSLVADFTQINPNGDSVQGKIWLKRSIHETGKMRLDYEPRIPQRIVIANNQLFVYDLNTDILPEPQDVSYMPAAFILNKTISLEQDAVIDNVTKSPDGTSLSLKLSQPVPLILTFSLYANGNIKALKGWAIEDSQGLITVILHNLHQNDVRLVSDYLFISPHS